MKRFLKFLCLVLSVLVALQCAAVSTSAKLQPLVCDPASKVPDRQVVAVETAATEAPVPAETEAPEAAAEEPAAPALPQADGYEEVPLFFQSDYPEELYGYGTVATHGSSITALAMVASYMTEHTYLPNELAGYFGAYSGNDMQRLEHASDELQLVWSRASNFHDAVAALEEGKVVIALMSETSLFTDSLHYIVFSGMDVDGNILVNDPKTSNYSHWRLESGFANGFPESDLCWGFSGGWIYDKNAMPAEPFVYEQEPMEEVECRYPQLELTKEDKDLLARLLWQEARGETLEGQQACAEVILNRLVSAGFPDTMRGVIFAEGQFPATEKLVDAKPTQTQYEAVERALKGPYLLPLEVVFYARFKMNENVWGQIGDHWFCYDWDTEVSAD